MTTNELSFFPAPYRGEDFRSTIYRYHVRSINSEFMESKSELFGLKSNKNQVFNRNMEHLIHRLPKSSRMTTDYILNHHTVFPLYKPFMSPNKLDVFYQDVKYGKGDKATFAGRLVNATDPKLLSEEPKYCPKCMEIELNSLGECFLHIEHQIQFLEVCPEHKVKLISECPTCGVSLSKPDAESITVSAKCSHGHDFNGVSLFCTDENHAFQLIIAEDILLFMCKAMDIGQQRLLEQYYMVLGNKGYIHDFTGEILTKKLLQDMMNSYTDDQLLAIGVNRNYIFSGKTHRSIFHKEYMYNHIILHILLMRFLSDCITNFLAFNNGYSVSVPFGTGPWKCFNPICPENTHPTITHCKRVYRSGMLSGEFQCRVCGFIYFKRWYMEKDDDNEETYTIKFMGHMWITRMAELREKGYTQKMIAEKLKVNPLTVSKYIKKMEDINYEEFDIPYSTMRKTEDPAIIFELLAANKEISAAARVKEKVNDSRDTISRLIPSVHTRKEIQLIATKEYNYLIKHDRQWMEEQLPPRKYIKRIDCEKVDDELSVIIEQTAKSVYGSDPPTQIKQYSIINALPEKHKNQYTGNRNNLPKCSAILTQYEESKDQYQIRHVSKLVSQLLAAGYRNVTFNSIVAFRRSYRNCSNQVKQKIEEILKQMGMDINSSINELTDNATKGSAILARRKQMMI